MVSLKDFPDVQADGAGFAAHAGHADEEGVVEPGVFAVARRLEFRRGAEIEAGLAVLVLPHHDEAAVADVDIDAVVGLDRIDGLDLRAAVLAVVELVVGAAGEDLAFHRGAFERAAHDGDDGASALGGLAHRVGAGAVDVESYDKFQGRARGILGGRLGVQRSTRQQQGGADAEETVHHFHY